MIRIIAKTEYEFSLHNLNNNEFVVTEQNPEFFLTFSGLKDNYETKFFDNKKDFNEFNENYKSEEVEQRTLKEMFRKLIEIIVNNGINKITDNYNLKLNDNIELEVITWKNGVISLIEYNENEENKHFRVDLDEKNKLGFFSEGKERFGRIYENLNKNF
jgi:hypothetical protein